MPPEKSLHQFESFQGQMDKLAAETDLLADELFHLENYVSLATYDPSGAIARRHDPKLIKFRRDHDLLLTSTMDQQAAVPAGRRQSRRVATSEPNLGPEGASDAQIEAQIELILKKRHSKPVAKPTKQTRGTKRAAKQEPKQPIKRGKTQNKRGRKPKAELTEVSEQESNEENDESEDDAVEVKDEKSDNVIQNDPNFDYTKVKKLTLIPTVAPPVITHPSHISKSEFSNMQELFNSYNNILEDPAPEIPADQFPAYIDSQHELVKKIKQGLDDELLILDTKENIFKNVQPNMKEPTMIKRNPNYNISKFKQPIEPFRIHNNFTHNDHLIAQGVKSAKLIKDMRSQRIQRCRKIAQMIEVHFKRISMEAERNEREFNKRRLRLARDTAKEVRKKWLVAMKAYKILEERERESERAVKSKEQLSKILDHSSKVLGNQIKAKTSSLEPDSEEDEDEVHSGDSSQEEDSDVNMSSSSDEEEHDKEDHHGEDDSKLTVEQLKAKYENLKEVKLKPVSIVDQLTEEERLRLQENNNDPLLTDSSFSGSDSDDSMSDEGTSSSSGDEAGPSHLHSLFGNPKKIESEEEDNDSVYSEKVEEEQTPSSSPDHQMAADNGGEEEEDGIPDVPVPSLLRGTLRPYQKQGLNWLASLYNSGTNGILADEMGLGKTIQTISLLSYLACEHNDWGPHLIVVPTSVMLNWEMEFKRFAPGFKVLTYYGSPQQRKEKRKGWNTPDSFHVCITSYQLVVHDQPIFRRKKWKYMILDEAHNIKNFRSQRWKSLLNFNTEHRLLLTGTPLQNNIIELWSLLYFLMPSSANGTSAMPEGFADLMDFQQWFGRPVDKIIQAGGEARGQDKETQETVNKLHQVLRPYLLRRLKQDVEKEMPGKYEHIVFCRLSKRQRLLYDDFMSRAQTRETLASGNFLSIINCLMQLRKVCNHPDLFEVRPILTSFSQQHSVTSDFQIKEIVTRKRLTENQTWQSSVDLNFVNLLPSQNNHLNSYHMETMKEKSMSSFFENQEEQLKAELKGKSIEPNFNNLEKYYEFILNKEKKDLLDEIQHLRYYNDLNINKRPLIPSDTIRAFTIIKPEKAKIEQLEEMSLIKPLKTRASLMSPTIEKYSFVTPNVVCKDMPELTLPDEHLQNELIYESQTNQLENPFHQSQVKTSIAFPDKSLLQYDCGKLQKLSELLHEIIPQGHRVLIFTQMSKVLDILEQFLNYNGYTYMRLDGSTKIEDRQLLTERFNTDTRVKCFILSSRAGGIGINLTGADTVVFYDSDWNPAMDKQCQDRCHRIGQTRDVHIYRFVSEYTIESNILKKAEQKRQLDNVVIQEGGFTTDYFSRLSVHEMLGEEVSDQIDDVENTQIGSSDFTKALEQAEDAEDSAAAKMAMTEVNVDTEDFTEDANAGASASATPAAAGDEGEMMAAKVAQRDEAEEEDYSDDDDVGHIDEYMIRFIAGGFSDLV